MIHKIKSLYDNGNGLTERKIAKELGLSRNTVSKYLHMPETEMTRQLDEIARTKKLAAYRVYIIQLLQTYPNLSAVKVMRKLKAKIDSLAVSDRSVRRYIQALKDEISFKQPRYYEPVVDMVPGVQCQVDGGELRGVMIGGKETTVYFFLSGIPTLSGAVLEILQLLQNIAGRKTGGPGVVGTAFAVGIVAETARRHVGFPAVGDDVRHLGVVAGKPVGGTIVITNLLYVELRGAGGQASWLVAVFRRLCGVTRRGCTCGNSTARRGSACCGSSGTSGRSRWSYGRREAIRPWQASFAALALLRRRPNRQREK